MYSHWGGTDDWHYHGRADARSYESEPRRPEHRQRYHTRRGTYDEHTQDGFLSHSRGSQSRDASGHRYHYMPSQSHERASEDYIHHEAETEFRSRAREPDHSGLYRPPHFRHDFHPSESTSHRLTPSTSPPPAPIPTSPSPEYLKLSKEPSQHTSSPPRKLIILDLNGTLLLRLRSVGAIYPRPYMPAFRDYLLEAATREWLDVMVWSSAQPHNVDRMVRRCFLDRRLGLMPTEESKSKNKGCVGESEEEKWDGKLVAVWGRDTLGLSRTDYSRKAKTTKDLEKVWTALPGNHSAQTTLLLDDSPAKARLQPFNHVCIREYTSALRDWDLSCKRRSQMLERECEEGSRRSGEEGGEEGKDKDKGKGKGKAKEITGLEGSEKDDAENASEIEKSQKTKKDKKKKKEKKEEEKKKKKQAQLDASLNASSSPPTLSSPRDVERERSRSESYDPTLLAVIGILDALRHESNVAGWIRRGGLWAGRRGAPTVVMERMEMVERAASPTDLEVEGGEVQDESLETKTEKEKETETRDEPPLSPSMAKRQRSMGTTGEGGDVKRTKHGIFGEADPDPDPDPVLEEEEEENEKEACLVAGNDADADADVLDPLSLPPSIAMNDLGGKVKMQRRTIAEPEELEEAGRVDGDGEGEGQGGEQGVKKMWFEDVETVRVWVGRGREALRKMGIEPDERDGVVLP